MRHGDEGNSRINWDPCLWESEAQLWRGGHAARCKGHGWGVLRNHGGEFLLSYAGDTGPDSITETELKSILMGIRMAHDRGYRQLDVETDSLTAVRLIKGDAPLYILAFIWWMTYRVRCDLWKIATLPTCILREGNQVADTMAKFGLQLNNSCTSPDSSPAFIALSLQADKTGTLFPKGF